MNSPVSQTLIEISPFLVTIVIEVLGTGANNEFEKQLEEIDNELFELGEFKPDLESAAAYSYDYKQSLNHYNVSIIAVTLVFMSKLATGSGNTDWVLISGILIILFVLVLKEVTSRYFTHRQPNKYWVNDCRSLTFLGQKFYFHYGAVGVLVANLVPIAAITMLNLL